MSNQNAEEMAKRIAGEICNTPSVIVASSQSEKFVAEFLARELQSLLAALAMANDAADKGAEGRGLGTALEECQRENQELLADRQRLDWAIENSLSFREVVWDCDKLKPLKIAVRERIDVAMNQPTKEK